MMASFGSRLQFLLAVAFWSVVSILMGSARGTDYPVGGNFGWRFNGTFFNYQNWASSNSFTVNDTLNFGYANAVNTDNFVPVVQSSEDCTVGGQPIPPNKTSFIVYEFEEDGQFSFKSLIPDYCNEGMRFNVTVTQANDGQLGPAPQDIRPSPLGPAPAPAPAAKIEPSSASSPNVKHKNKNGVGWIVGVGTGSGVVLVLMALLVMIKRNSWERLTKPGFPKGGILSFVRSEPRRSDSHSHSWRVKDVKSGEIDWPWGPHRFSYKALKGATNSFHSSLVVGEGGFGTVYKGFMGDSPRSPPVAVKRLSQYARQGAREFMAELNIISQLRHRNLVQLVGWCDDDDELILVYEYMPNGDLDDLIFGGYHGDDSAGFSPLSWKCRYNTFCGVATALVYLHEEWEQRVVHRDVKTSNVMLDSQFNARLGDFGLARLSAHSQAPRTTLVAGTIGYLAPEFNLTGKATDKTDVYAFGVVVLEVCSARRPLTSNCILVDWVWDLHKEDKLLDAVDHKLDVRSASDEEEMQRALRVGLLCCHPDPAARPSMRHVLNILTGETPLPRMPRSKPVAVFTEDPYDRFSEPDAVRESEHLIMPR